ncbi:Sec-independent protein translocase protein TatB [Erythrobacter neustonensis]|uniref:Sec-independent protein translocase protein TatB n=1 Tax=Erythrobacter neustonensis TaxID=1112 RepID=A0A192D3F0_9SPHN|nr:Sec-independent protein translocase protein TatB [Erythrobacter neustonensis]ANK13013.1 twin arginine-targeting protein translocase TatB [Erythrobacter neustonensis]
MFDIGAGELLVILIVAVVVIGPKDLPLAMRTAGRWIGKMRRVSAHFRSGIDAMVREAELEEMEKKWKAQNEEIMRRSAALTEAEAGAPVMTGPPPVAQGQTSAPMNAQASATDTPPVEALAEPLAQLPLPDPEPAPAQAPANGSAPKGNSDV